MIEALDTDALLVSLQTWDPAENDYDESWHCYVRATDSEIRDIRGPNLRPAKRELRGKLFETLGLAVEKLADSTLVRVVA